MNSFEYDQHEHKWKPYMQGDGYIQEFCRVCGLERRVTMPGWKSDTEVTPLGENLVLISNVDLAAQRATTPTIDHYMRERQHIRGSAITDADIAEVLTGVRPLPPPPPRIYADYFTDGFTQPIERQPLTVDELHTIQMISIAIAEGRSNSEFAGVNIIVAKLAYQLHAEQLVGGLWRNVAADRFAPKTKPLTIWG